MIEGNYIRILEKIAKASGLSKEELELKVSAKRDKLSGLISKEGAAQVIAAELGISFENEKLKIDELLPGMRQVNTSGKVINLSPVRTFTTKKGDEGKVANLWIADDSSNIKIVLWDTNHIALIEKGDIAEGVVVEISNGSMRDSEIHLGSFSEIKLGEEEFENVVTEKVFHEKKISDFVKGENSAVRAFVVQVFEPRFFHVCPQCKKKAVSEGEVFSCNEHGKIVPEKRALINIVLDDGTESIRAVLFHESLSGIGITDPEDGEKLAIQKSSLLGKEMVFSGNVRNNSFFNTPEMIIDGVKDVNYDEVIANLEKK
ncbi:MAG TPA: hypothetical protein ENI22_00355 [Candidatus Pacearchaeota archaeon]|nr:hypothetical protein [Candidatus Pacearchaeota archaeon]